MTKRSLDPTESHASVLTLSEDPYVRIGAGALREVGIVAERLAMHRAMIVCDPHFRHSNFVQAMGVRLREHGIASRVVSQVTPTPRYADVHHVLAAMQDGLPCDGVISFGGGSTMDVGKVASLLGKHGGAIEEYAHERRTAPDTLPHIAIPTTAGTGAESSGYAFLLKSPGGEHSILHHDILRPQAVLIDPQAHVSMPPTLTATSGINALCDAVESYVSSESTPASDSLALEAMHLISQWLETAYKDPENVEARQGMARASYIAGVAFDQSGLGLVDSIGLVLSEMFNIGQSAANAILLPHVMAYDAFSVGERLGDVASALGHKSSGSGEKAAAEDAIAAVTHLKDRIGLRENLADQGLSWDDLYLCANQILHHPFIRRSPRPLDQAGLTEILLGSMETQRLTLREPPRVAKATAG